MTVEGTLQLEPGSVLNGKWVFWPRVKGRSFTLAMKGEVLYVLHRESSWINFLALLGGIFRISKWLQRETSFLWFDPVEIILERYRH